MRPRSSSASHSRRPENHRQCVQPAYRIIETPGRFAAELDRLDPARERRQNGLGLQARDHLSHAGVNAVSEAHVAECLSTDVELFGILPFAWVAVRGCEEQQHFLSL